jgi:hypothetical protein
MSFLIADTFRDRLGSALCWLTLCLAIPACNEPQPRTERPAREESEDVERSSLTYISWINAKLLLVSGDHPRRDWIVDRETGHSVVLDALEEHDSTYASPDGKKLLTLGKDDQLLVADVSNDLEGPLTIRRLPIPPFPEMDDEAFKRMETFAFWLNDGRALVARNNVDLDYEQCYVYAAEGGRMSAFPGCLSSAPLSSNRRANHIVGLGDEMYAFYYSNEGEVEAAIFEFTPEAGVKMILHEMTYGLIASIDVHREASTGTLYLASPFPVDSAGSTERIGEEPLGGFPTTPATLYRFEQGRGFQPTGRTVPHGAVLRSVESGDLAWVEIERAELCTSSSGQQAVCHPLPGDVQPR